MNSHNGLSSHEAQKRLLQFGPNELAEKKPPNDISLLLAQLKSPLIFILIVSALMTYFLGDIIDTGIILLAVFINTILGFFQERKAQHSLLALKRMLTPQARVTRNGSTVMLDHRLIVPGDVVLVSAGDRIAADGNLIEATSLYVNEAMLTGESMPVSKNTDENGRLVSMGTTVTSGHGVFIVTQTGQHTKIGALASSISQTKEEETPLQREIKKLARLLAGIVLIICFLLFTLGIARGEDTTTMFATAVAVAVSAIPEGMVVSLTVILAVGMQRILKRKAIVRRLIAAETLGSLTTLCVDKTGTLTEGVMRVSRHKLTDKTKALQAAILANNLDDPIETALWEWAQSQDHVDPQKMTDTTPRVSEIPFNAVHKYMAVSTEDEVYVKGAPEILLSKSTLTSKERIEWQKYIDDFAKDGLRIIAVAWKPASSKILDKEINNLSFLGIFGVTDPPRGGVKEALDLSKKAGVKIKVITGDYRVTAEAILHSVGLHITNPSIEILEGKELADLTATDLAKRIDRIILFCRVTPEQKLKIVDALQQKGEVVAMTGDGVNDAPAIKKADIGIVVAGASDVARETADLVLLDSNFQTIVAAIEEGRAMFDNIRKVVLYLLSDAFTEIFLVITSIIAGLPLPLTAIQILWINILSDGLPNLALSVEPKEHDIMKRNPRPRQTAIISQRMAILTFCIGSLKAILALLLFTYTLSHTGNLQWAQTITFAMIGSGSLLYIFSLRTLGKPIWHDNIFKNPWLIVAVVVGFILQLLVIYYPPFASLFHSHPLDFTDWILVLGASSIIILGIELAKIFANRNRYAISE